MRTEHLSNLLRLDYPSGDIITPTPLTTTLPTPTTRLISQHEAEQTQDTAVVRNVQLLRGQDGTIEHQQHSTVCARGLALRRGLGYGT